MSLLDALLRFLFKYPARVFEKGTLVWQGLDTMAIVLPAVAVVGGAALLTYRRAGKRARPLDRAMLAQRCGSIVNISSLWAVEPHLDAPISSTLRAALAAFTKLYADRYAGSGIRMNSILPGFVDTYPVPEKFRRAIPVDRVGTAEEIAAAVAFLASDEATYLTGQSLRIDGGLTRSF